MKKVIIFTLIYFFTVSDISFGQGPNSMGKMKLPMGKWWLRAEVAEKLNLTSEEQQRLDNMFVQSRRKMIDLRSNVQKEKLELDVILNKKDFDENACMNRFKKFQDARTTLANEQFKFLIETRKLLGIERFQQLETEFRDRRMHPMKGRQGQKGHIKRKFFKNC
jgi:Spy/CpxP family protein refolding chaperone